MVLIIFEKHSFIFYEFINLGHSKDAVKYEYFQSKMCCLIKSLHQEQECYMFHNNNTNGCVLMGAIEKVEAFQQSKDRSKYAAAFY